MLAWVSAEMRTGDVIGYLPSLLLGADGNGKLTRSISNYSNADALLILEGAPKNWQRATKELAAWLACWDDSDTTRAIQWCGYVVFRNPSAATDTLDLTLVTAEGYLTRRYVGDVTYPAGTLRSAIFADLLTRYVRDGATPGIPMLLQATGNDPALTEDLVLQNADNRTVMTTMTNICGELGGEFAVDWTWSTDNTQLIPTMRLADRIGTPAPAGRKPAVVFSLPGQLIDFQQPTDYSDGKGANRIVYYSTGSGDEVPYSAPVVDTSDLDRPAVEYRDQPAASVSEDALNRYAKQALPILAPGSKPVSLTADLGRLDHRRFGRDWMLGDDLGFSVASVDGNGQPILAFPDGVDGVGRAISVDITRTTITPILADKTVYKETA